MRRVSRQKMLRQRLGLMQAESAEVFHLPIMRPCAIGSSVSAERLIIAKLKKHQW
jgi:hypothetical protein